MKQVTLGLLLSLFTFYSFAQTWTHSSRTQQEFNVDMADCQEEAKTGNKRPNTRGFSSQMSAEQIQRQLDEQRAAEFAKKSLEEQVSELAGRGGASLGRALLSSLGMEIPIDHRAITRCMNTLGYRIR